MYDEITIFNQLKLYSNSSSHINQETKDDNVMPLKYQTK